MNIYSNQSYKPHNGSSGFSLIDFLVAIFILLIGLVGMLGLFAHGLVALTFAEESLIAKQKARETLESIFTARNTQQVTFDQIRNVGDGVGIFQTGLQALKTAGNDGLVGTSDDGNVESIVLAGPDGMLGTSDDKTRVLNEFRRQISITTLNDDLRQIIVTIRYTAPQRYQRNYQVATYISRFR